MKNVAIAIRGLGKRYRIGRIRDRTYPLRDMIAGALATPFRRKTSIPGVPRCVEGGGHTRSSKASFGDAHRDHWVWVLRDVSLDVGNGEILGVIGRNGAGKSTLLKLLARITDPTEGYAEIHGRVGCLLEVGTGFHPELTGRENIYLNGAILGMKRAEIRARFDEIVEFAEIEDFLDTPVKYYSSGMYVRLAFSVSAHLEPDVLIVDEVLAVGDGAFQKKCLMKVENLKAWGSTILFVSHDLEAIRRTCDRVAWLCGGEVRSLGNAREVVDDYERYLNQAHVA